MGTKYKVMDKDNGRVYGNYHAKDEHEAIEKMVEIQKQYHPEVDGKASFMVKKGNSAYAEIARR